jgi:hypothetical protein
VQDSTNSSQVNEIFVVKRIQGITYLSVLVVFFFFKKKKKEVTTHKCRQNRIKTKRIRIRIETVPSQGMPNQQLEKHPVVIP